MDSDTLVIHTFTGVDDPWDMMFDDCETEQDFRDIESYMGLKFKRYLGTNVCEYQIIDITKYRHAKLRHGF